MGHLDFVTYLINKYIQDCPDCANKECLDKFKQHADKTLRINPPVRIDLTMGAPAVVLQDSTTLTLCPDNMINDGSMQESAAVSVFDANNATRSVNTQPSNWFSVTGGSNYGQSGYPRS